MNYYHSKLHFTEHCPAWYLRDQWKLHQIKGFYHDIIFEAHQPKIITYKTAALSAEALYNEIKIPDLMIKDHAKIDYKMHLDHHNFGTSFALLLSLLCYVGLISVVIKFGVQV